MPVAPTLTDEQRKQAAQRSLELRQARAKLKGYLATGQDRPLPAIENVWRLPIVDGMKVYDLLVSLPGIGRAKALKILAAAKIPEKNTVRACGPKQRERLFALLG